MLRIIGWLFFILLVAVVFCYIGVPGRVINRNVSSDSFARIKEANMVLVAAQVKAPHNTTRGLTQFLLFEYGRIKTTDDVDNLFPGLSAGDRQKIELLFVKGDVSEIDMHVQNCISYLVKTVGSSPLIFSSREEIYLIFDAATPSCDCASADHDSGDTAEKEKLGNGWAKLDKVIKRKPFRG